MRILLLLVFFIAAGTASAANLIEITTERNGLALKYVVDEKQTLRIIGLPIAGNFHFNIKTSTLFAQLPGEGITYAIPYGMYSYRLPTAKIEKQGDWKEYFGEKSYYWRFMIDGNTCTHAFANTAAAQKTGLDVSDVSRLQAALAWLVGPTPSGCGQYLIEPAAGEIIGFPLYAIHSGAGHSEVTDIVEVEGEENALPIPTVSQINAAAHTRFLKTMLPDSERVVFEANSGNLPWRHQVKALKALLRQRINNATR